MADSASTEPHQPSEDAGRMSPSRPEKEPHILHRQTLRRPLWTYFHLSLFSLNSQSTLDILTVKTYINAALQRSLGLSGLAVSLDILKVDRKDVWIRIPREDAAMVHEALGAWSSAGAEGAVRWVVKGRDEWLGRLVSGDGGDLFGEG